MPNRSPLPLIVAAVALVAGVLYASSQPAAQPLPTNPVCPGPYCPDNPTPYPYPDPNPAPQPRPQPQPQPSPCPGPGPCPRPQPRRPWGDDSTGAVAPDATLAVGEIKEGGPVAPDGVTEVQCDLPVELRHKNLPGRDGAGCCVFASIQHSARYQQERRLWDFLEEVAKHEPGGGFPQKVDAMIQKYAPGTPYLQHTGKDLEFLKAALRGGRMPACTYCGMDVHYGPNSRVSHMINPVHLDERWAAILDNNYVGERQILWMSVDEFAKRRNGNGEGWDVVLLSPPPMPPPRN